MKTLKRGIRETIVRFDFFTYDRRYYECIFRIAPYTLDTHSAGRYSYSSFTSSPPPLRSPYEKFSHFLWRRLAQSDPLAFQEDRATGTESTPKWVAGPAWNSRLLFLVDHSSISEKNKMLRKSFRSNKSSWLFFHEMDSLRIADRPWANTWNLNIQLFLWRRQTLLLFARYTCLVLAD